MKKGKHTTNLASINKTMLSELPVPLPSLEEQKVIMDQVEDRFLILSKVESDVDRQLGHANDLRQSILKKAFEGKLVPQNPKDEPASELLKRIQAEREKGRDSKGRRTPHSPKPHKRAKIGAR